MIASGCGMTRAGTDETYYYVHSLSSFKTPTRSFETFSVMPMTYVVCLQARADAHEFCF
jgi:hypothetical protein